jgi:hypothetical protein
MIIVPKEAPENMEKALRETVELIGAQLNEIADKYGVMVDVTAYKDKGDESGKHVYIAITDKKHIVSVFRYLTGEYAKDTEEASVIRR